MRQLTNMEIKKNNRNRIFRYISTKEITSNPDIAYELKMSLPTVTQNTKELLEKGLIEEKGDLNSTGGRRAKGLAIVKDLKFAVGIDITRNHLGIVLLNLAKEIISYERLPLIFENNEKYYLRVNNIIENIFSKYSIEREKILGIGISLPGILNLKNETITESHVLNLKNISLKEIKNYFSYPCIFMNDANAGAYAEGINNRKNERFFYLSLSNTVGGAIFSQKDLILGENYRCGEVGHMTINLNGDKCYCGKKGCLDVYCSAKKLESSGKLETFFLKLKNNDKKALKIWEEYIKYLVIALKNIHMLLDCKIVIGGYVGGYIEKYISDIWEKILDEDIFENSCFISASNYKMESSALGAALSIVESFIIEI